MITLSVLAPRTYEKVPITFMIGRSRNLTTTRAKQKIQRVMNDALSLTIAEVEMWIDNKAPMLTGALRASLKQFLNRSTPPPAAANELRGVRLILGVGADVPYAKYVNRMPTGQVRHDIDPRAIGFYHDAMIEFAKDRLRTNLQKAKNDNFG